MATNNKIIRERGDASEDRLEQRIAEKAEQLANEDPKMKVARDRIEAFRDQWNNTALPDIDSNIIPGFHLCWLSSTNTYDTIDKRIALGYEPVKAVELGQGYEHLAKMNSGKFEGCVSCNEMILFKIPSDLYNEAMKLMHFEMPLEHQQNITNSVRGAAENDKGGKSLLEGGLLEMEKTQVDPSKVKFEN